MSDNESSEPSTLASAPVDSCEVERKTQEILNEWIKSYFNGTTQLIAGVSRAFPNLNVPNGIFFNQTALPIALTSPIIHWLFTDLTSRERMEAVTTKLLTVDFLSSVYVRASATGVGNTGDFNVRRVADLLRAVIVSPERNRIQQAGIHHVRCPRGPVPVDAPGWQSRLLIVTGQLQYRVTYPTPD